MPTLSLHRRRARGAHRPAGSGRAAGGAGAVAGAGGGGDRAAGSGVLVRDADRGAGAGGAAAAGGRRDLPGLRPGPAGGRAAGGRGGGRAGGASRVRYEPDAGFLGAPFVAMPFVDGPIPASFTAGRSVAHRPARRRRPPSGVDVVPRHARRRSTTSTPTGSACGPGSPASSSGGSATSAGPPTARRRRRWPRRWRWCRAHRPAATSRRRRCCGATCGSATSCSTPTASRRGRSSTGTWRASVPAEMDLAWFLALEQVTGGPQRHDRARLRHARRGHRARSSTASAARCRTSSWYEVFALVRASAVSTRIALLFERAGQAIDVQGRARIRPSPAAARADRARGRRHQRRRSSPASTRRDDLGGGLVGVLRSVESMTWRS